MKKRTGRYLTAFDNGKLDEHYARKGKVLGLHFCPVCGLKKIYIVFDVDGSILKARCSNQSCRFLYNPNDIKMRGQRVFCPGCALYYGLPRVDLLQHGWRRGPFLSFPRPRV